MRFLFASALVCASLALAADPSAPSGIVPNRYIVEFDSTAHLKQSGLKRAATPHEAIYNQLAERGVAFTLNHEFQSDVFVGASISLTTDLDFNTLASLTGVLNLLPVEYVSRPDDISVDQSWGAAKTKKPKPTSTSTASPTATTICTKSKGKQSCSTSTYPTATPSPTTGFSYLPQIDAVAAQAAGNKGKGVKIGIIDGGVDYTRTPLGGCFGDGCKIAGGYDFVGDDFDGSNTPVPDSDPFDDCYSHGSIVAGIIGANDNEYNVTGVAPEASIYSYRVFSCYFVTTNDLVFLAMQTAYNDGMDVINLSVGGPNGWTESALSVLASRIVNNGTTVIASAGNSGQVGSFYANYPAGGIGVINAGSVDNAVFPAHKATISTGYGPIVYYNYQNFDAGTYPIYVFSTDPTVTGNACQVPEDTPDLSSYLVIVRDGGPCTVSNQARNLFMAGAERVFVIADDGVIPEYENFPLINFARISYTDGSYLLKQNGTGLTVTFKYDPIAIPNTFTGNTTTFFSAIGPTWDMYFAPTVLAPGRNIIGVVPTSYANWSISDGTSWSAAYVTGAAALYIAANPDASPQDVREAMEATAVQLSSSVTDNTLESVAVQGAGRLSVFNSLNVDTIVTPTELLLNDTANFVSTQYITITNTGRQKLKYRLTHVPAGTGITFSPSNNQSTAQPVPKVSNAARVDIGKKNLNLKAGESQTVLLKFTAPSGLHAKTFPVYSGWIEIASDDSTVQVAYLGLAANLKDHPVLDGTDVQLGYKTPVITGSDGTTQTAPTTYTLQADSYPVIKYRLAGGTPLVVFDLVAANANLGFAPTYNSRRSRSVVEKDQSEERDEPAFEARDLEARGRKKDQSDGFFRGYLYYLYQMGKKKGNNNTNTFQKVPIIGNLGLYEYSPRSSSNIDGEGNEFSTFGISSGTFSNGTAIPNGTYKFLLRALKITGDVTKEADYEAWLSSQTFTIAR